MKKFLLSLFCYLMAFASIQAEEATLSFANTAQRVSYSDSQQIWGQNGITFTNNKASSSTKIGDYAPVRVYKNSEVIIECSLGNITQIIFDCNKSDHATTLKNSIGNVATNSSDKVTVTLAGASNRFTFTPSAAIWIDELTVTYIVDSGETPSVPEAPATPEITPGSCSFNDGESLKVTISAAEGATIHYTLDGTAPTKDSEVYSGPIVINETTTVKAIAVNTAGSSEVAEATYTKNVTTPETPNEQEVTDVLDRTLTGVTGTTYSDWIGKTSNSNAIYAGNSSGGYESIQLRTTNNNSGIVTTASGGKVKKVVVTWNNEKTNTARILQLYGKNEAYSSAADLYDDAKKGTLIKEFATTETTFEIKGDYTYIGLRSKSDAMYLTSISITWDASNVVEAVAQPVISPEAAEFKEGDNVTVTITTETEGATIYYTLDGSDPTTDSYEYNEAITISATTTVKAIAVKKDLQNSAIATKIFTRVITLENATVADVIAAHKAGDNVESATVIGYIVGSNKVLNSTTEVKTNIIIADNADENDISNCIHVELKKDTDIRTALNLADNPGNYKKKVILTGNNVEGYLDGTGLKNVNSYEFVIEGEWATIFRSYEGVAPAGYEAYIVTGVNNGWATLKQITGVIPAKTGVILKKNENAVADSSVNADVEGNLLMGSIGSEKVTEDAYVLGVVDGVVGLYKAEMNQQDENGNVAWLNNANKAYLPASALGTANKVSFYGFRIDEEENTTAIEEVEIVNENVIYDLSGRRISEITAPGIYVVGGKKVLVK